MVLKKSPIWRYNRIGTVTFVLPEGCSLSQVDTSPAAETQGMENGKAFIYFERADIALDTDSTT